MRAQTTATSASVPFVIQRFVPFSTQPLAAAFGLRAHAARVAAEVGLGETEAADRRPAAIGGSQRSFCASEP